MATYGIKDSANMIFKNLKSGNIDLFMDYANVTTNEWTSDRVYATKKGTNAIAWDNSREGTLAVETETFDWNYLAMIVGSEVAEGKTDIMQREVYTVNSSRALEIEGIVDPNSVSVIKLKEDKVEHDGTPIPSATGNRDLLPVIARNVVAAANDDSVILTWDASIGAESYEVSRDGDVIAVVANNTFRDDGLTPETEYEYTVLAINEYGKAPLSAVVEVETSESGTNTRTPFEARNSAIEEAEGKEGELSDLAGSLPTFEFADGKVRFNENANIGDSYAIYYQEEVQEARTITISSDKFPDSYEIWGDAYARRSADGVDEFIQIHYFNARPQSNFTFTQSASDPTSLSVTFDLFPNGNNDMAEYKLIK